MSRQCTVSTWDPNHCQPNTILAVLKIVECDLVVSSVNLVVVILYHVRELHAVWICLKLRILLLSELAV